MLGNNLQVGPGRVVNAGVGQLELGLEASLIGLGQLDLVVFGEQRVPTDLIQVQTERIRRLKVETRARRRGHPGTSLSLRS